MLTELDRLHSGTGSVRKHADAQAISQRVDSSFSQAAATASFHAAAAAMASDHTDRMSVISEKDESGLAAAKLVQVTTRSAAPSDATSIPQTRSEAASVVSGVPSLSPSSVCSGVSALPSVASCTSSMASTYNPSSIGSIPSQSQRIPNPNPHSTVVAIGAVSGGDEKEREKAKAAEFLDQQNQERMVAIQRQIRSSFPALLQPNRKLISKCQIQNHEG